MALFNHYSSGIYTLENWIQISYLGIRVEQDISTLDTEQAFELVSLQRQLWSENVIAFLDFLTGNLWMFECVSGQGSFARIPTNLDTTRLDKFEKLTGTFYSVNMQNTGFGALKKDLVTRFPDQAIYAALIKAINATISFQLTEKHNSLPLYRDVFALARSSTDIISQTPVTLIRLSSYLTVHGTLVVSLNMIEDTASDALYALGQNQSLDISDDQILLHPKSTPAILVKSLVTSKLLSLARDWCKEMEFWLKCVGYVIQKPQNPQSWVMVKISCVNEVKKDSTAQLNILWPKCLCLSRRQSKHIYKTGETKGMSPSRTTGYWKPNGEMIDWLGFTQDWVKSKLQRERALAEIKHQDEFLRNINEPTLSERKPSSIGGTEVHAQAIYPTPPDVMGSAQPGVTPPASTSMSSLADLQFQKGEGKERIANVQFEPHHNTRMHPEIPAVPSRLIQSFDDNFVKNELTKADFDFFDDTKKKVKTSTENILPKNPNGFQIPTDKRVSAASTAVESQDLQSVEAPAKSAAEQDDVEMTNVPKYVDSKESFPSAKHLTPDEVRKELFAMKQTSHKSRGIYGALNFSEKLSKIDDKYEVSGIFGSETPKVAKENKKDPTMPNSISLPEFDRHRDDLSPASDSSDEDSAVKAAKGTPKYDTEALLPETNPLILRSLIVSASKPACFEPGKYGIFTNFCPPRKHEFLSLVCKDPLFITVAQIVQEQTALSSINGSLFASQPLTTQFGHTTNEYDFSQLCNSMQDISGCNGPSDLVPFISLSDGNDSIPRPRAPLLNKLEVIAGAPLQLTVPSIRVRRQDLLWDFSPPALQYWDVLGLGPCGGAKDVVAYTICPRDTVIARHTNQFLKELGSCYENSKLGEHLRGDNLSTDGGHTGILKYSITESAQDPAISQVDVPLINAFSTIFSAVLTYSVTKRNPNKEANRPDGQTSSFVIYVINTFEHLASYYHKICFAFSQIYGKYTDERKRSQSVGIDPDIQLQIVPLSFLMDGPISNFSQTNELQTLAREVYNRCRSPVKISKASAIPIDTGWSIQLSETLPKKIAFEIKAEMPLNVYHENSQFHVAYSISASKNWISVAFSDNQGEYQTKATYFVSESESFDKVAQEIWATCMEIMQVRKVNWRFCIARVGYMTSQEVEVWSNLACVQQAFSLITVLVTIDLAPPLAIVPTLEQNSNEDSEIIAPTMPTPVETPKPIIGMSPAASGATPAGETPPTETNDTDEEAQLVDTSDETWAMILRHRPVIEMGPDHHRQTLSSGFLVKASPPSSSRCETLEGFDTEDEYDADTSNTRKVYSIGVHLLWGRNQGNSGENGQKAWDHAMNVHKGLADGLLKEYMVLFRDLALLAKVRDLDDCMRGLIPWHVLVAWRSGIALDAVYGTDNALCSL